MRTLNIAPCLQPMQLMSKNQGEYLIMYMWYLHNRIVVINNTLINVAQILKYKNVQNQSVWCTNKDNATMRKIIAQCL